MLQISIGGRHPRRQNYSGGIDIYKKKIDNLLPYSMRSSSHRKVFEETKDNFPGVLLEIRVGSEPEFPKRFVYLRYDGHDRMIGSERVLLLGFDSYEDYLADRFGTSEYLYKVPCRK